MTVSTVVAVDCATAFEMFTDDVDAWWKRGPSHRIGPGDSSVMRFEAGVGGRFLEVLEADRTFQFGTILVWEPGRRLVFEWRGATFAADERTEVEVTFETAGQGTRVTIEHRGWDALRADHPVRHGMVGEPFLRFIGGFWSDLALSIRAWAAARGD